MTSIHGQQSVPAPSPVARAAPPQPPAPGPRPVPIAPAPAALRPQDERRHGRYLRATHAVVQTRMTAPTQPCPAPAPKPISQSEARVAGSLFLDVCGMIGNLRNAPAFAKAAQSLDKHCQQAYGRNFNTGVVSGLLAEAVTLDKALINAGWSEGTAIAIIGCLLLAAEAVPGLNVAVNYTLGSLGAAAVARELGHSLQDIGQGETFAGGQKAGHAAVAALLASISLKHAKLQGPAMENLQGAKVSTLVSTTWQRLSHVVPEMGLPQAERAVVALKQGLQHVLSHLKERPVATLSVKGVEGTHLSATQHEGSHPGPEAHHARGAHGH